MATNTTNDPTRGPSPTKFPNPPKPPELPPPLLPPGRIRSNSTRQVFTLQKPPPGRSKNDARVSVLESRAGNQVVSGFASGMGMGIMMGDRGVFRDAQVGEAEGADGIGMGRGNKTAGGGTVMGRGRMMELPVGSPPPRTPAGAVHPPGTAVIGTTSGTVAGRGDGGHGSGYSLLLPSLPGNLNVVDLPDPTFEFAVFSDDEDNTQIPQPPQHHLNSQSCPFSPFRPSDSQLFDPQSFGPHLPIPIPSVPAATPSPEPLFILSPIIPDNDPILTPPLPPTHATEPPETTSNPESAEPLPQITRRALPHRRQSYDQYCARKPIWQREWWENTRRADEPGGGGTLGFVDPREVMLRPVHDDTLDNDSDDDDEEYHGADNEIDDNNDADQDVLAQIELRGIPIPPPHRTGAKTRGGGVLGGNPHTTGSWGGRKRAHSLSQIVEGEVWRVFTPQLGNSTGLGKSLPSVMEAYTPRGEGGREEDGDGGKMVIEGDVEIVDTAMLVQPAPSTGVWGGRGIRGTRGARGGSTHPRGRGGARPVPSIPPHRCRRYTISTTSPSIDLGLSSSLLPPKSFPPTASISSQPPPSKPPSQLEPPPPIPSSPAPTHLLTTFHTYPPSPSTIPPPPNSASLTKYTAFHRSHLHYLITEIRLHTATITTNPTPHNTRTARRMLPGYITALERLLVVLEREEKGDVEEGDFEVWREGWRGIGELVVVLGMGMERLGVEAVGRWWRAREEWGRERDRGQQGGGE